MRNPQRRAILELLAAVLFWGLSFPAVEIALQYFTPTGVGLIRPLLSFFLGESLLLIGVYFLKYRRSRKNTEGLELQLKPSSWKKHLIESAVPGSLLGLIILSTNFSLKYTSSSLCAFLSCLYVVEVPLFSHLLFKRQQKALNGMFYIGILLAVFGVALIGNIGHLSEILGLDPKSPLNLGDSGKDLVRLYPQAWIGNFLAVVGSLLGTAQILVISKLAKTTDQPFRLNNFQNLWACLWVIPAWLIEPALIRDRLPVDFLTRDALITRAIVALVSVSALTGLLSFSLQIRSQKYLTPHLTSLLCILESPIAFIFAYFLLGQTLLPGQAVGGLLIVTACFIAIQSET